MQQPFCVEEQARALFRNDTMPCKVPLTSLPKLGILEMEKALTAMASSQPVQLIIRMTATVW